MQSALRTVRTLPRAAYRPWMSRGVVLWPDDQTSHQVRSIWDELAAVGLPSMATETHRVHQPHVPLIVADDLVVGETLEDLADLPSSPLPLLIESVGVVPGGHLLLTVTASQELLAEQARVHRATRAFADSPWSHYLPGQWLPHMTLARA